VNIKPIHWTTQKTPHPYQPLRGLRHLPGIDDLSDIDWEPLPEEKQAEKRVSHAGEIVATANEAGRRCKPERQPHP
jgi:hypothetical protein